MCSSDLNFYLKLSPEFVVQREPEIQELIDNIQLTRFAVKGRLDQTRSVKEESITEDLSSDYEQPEEEDSDDEPDSIGSDASDDSSDE